MPKLTKIFSENDIFQNLDALKRKREKRNELRQFLVEGVRNINHVLKYGWRIDAFIYSPEKKVSGWATEILKKSLKNSGAKNHYEMPFKLLQKLSGKEETSELLATIEIPEDDLGRISYRENFLAVVFDRPASPGNLGTLIRSCDALGVDGLIITGHAVDVYAPETVAASTGSLFSLPIVRLPSQKELMSWLKNLDEVQIVGTDEKGTQNIDRFDFVQPTVLLVGNETWGLSAAYKELCDAMVKIPMQGSASSLNVACASSIVLYEIYKQRGFTK